MSLAPELAAFLGKPPSAPPNGRAVIGRADQGHRLRDHEHPEKTNEPEKPMPTGVYKRKPRAAKAEGKPEPKPRKARMPRAAKSTVRPRFGVFDDGTIEMKLASCTGTIGTKDARALVEFLRRIGIKA